MKLTVFDLDHTLIPIDTGDLWAKWLVGRGGLPNNLYTKIENYHNGYVAGNVNLEELIEFHFELLSMFDRIKLNRLRAEFIEQVVIPKLNPNVFTLIEEKIKSGQKVVIASGTPFFVVSSIAPLLGVGTVIAAKGEVDSNLRFTGKLSGSHSYSEGKVRLLKSWLASEEKEGRKYTQVEAWSDSINDLPLLNWASSMGGRVVAANPDIRLAKKAQENSWEIVNLFPKE